MPTQNQSSHILGLDIGSNSVGWALLELKENKPNKIVKTGVRIFSAGTERDIERGQDIPRAAERRAFRQRRRLLSRQSMRLHKVAGTLQEIGLLPKGSIETPKARFNYFQNLEKDIFSSTELKQAPHTLLYKQRARALDEKIEPIPLGRIFYHLALRRGFLSNRKAAPKKNEKTSELKQEIHDLESEIKQTGSRTLGEYFSKLDPTIERIRTRHTSRQMYIDEFFKIWNVQSQYYPVMLTDEAKKNLFKAIFYQRPLKSAKNLIGECTLESGRKRCFMSALNAQRFRLLQKVNDLKVIDKISGEIRPLKSEERVLLIEHLEKDGNLSFKRIREILNLKDCVFNFERENGDDKLPGNRTASKLRKIFGGRWNQMSQSEQDKIIQDILSFRKEDALEKRGVNYWKLNSATAKEFAALSLERGYCSLSKLALSKLLPLMEKGMPYASARKQIYPDKMISQVFDELPPLEIAQKRRWMPQLRNPNVARALTEVRKVVSHIVKAYGKPHLIRIELARDLKKPRKDREEIWKRNEQNRKAREKAAEELLKEHIRNPSRGDIQKYLLADECNWQCPYTGKRIGFNQLFGSTPSFDVEHIIPFARSLDDSFLNKTLCDVEENRNRKKNKTPWEAYGSDGARWTEIINRVKKFNGPAKEAKLRRFLIKDVRSLDDFTSRQLNDTRYASRLAVQYLSLLYGANPSGIVKNGGQRIQATQGQVTHFMRDVYGLNAILNDGGQKSRDDHRHHSVDAIAIALTTSATIKMLSDAASRAQRDRRKRFGSVELPWNSFEKDARKAIAEVIPSHQPHRKINGPLHDQTIYSKLIRGPEGKSYVHVRRAVDKLSKKEVDEIVDPVIQNIVKKKLGDGDPKKVFANPEDHPALKTKGGLKIPIHKVRIRIKKRTTSIGEGSEQKNVIPGSNHHVEIIESKDKKGKIKWEGVIVTRLEAFDRLRKKLPIITKSHGADKKFVFSLSGGDIIQLKENGDQKLFVIRTISKMRQQDREYVNLAFVDINDARKKDEIIKTKMRRTSLLEPLRKAGCQKVIVTPLGEIRTAHD